MRTAKTYKSKIDDTLTKLNEDDRKTIKEISEDEDDIQVFSSDDEDLAGFLSFDEEQENEQETTTNNNQNQSTNILLKSELTMRQKEHAKAIKKQEKVQSFFKF